MKNLIETSSAVFGIILLSLIAIPLYTLIGGILGWIVGLFFGKTILGIFASLGIYGFSMFQIGAFLAFIGSLLRFNVTVKNK